MCISCNNSFLFICPYTVGVMYHISLPILSITWVVQIIHIWLTLFFPISSRWLTKNSKFIHVSVIVGTVFLCSIGPILTLSVYRYQVTRLPPGVCTPSNVDLHFYTIYLPIAIITAVGVSFLINIFWIVWKVSCIHIQCHNDI